MAAGPAQLPQGTARFAQQQQVVPQSSTAAGGQQAASSGGAGAQSPPAQQSQPVPRQMLQQLPLQMDPVIASSATTHQVVKRQLGENFDQRLNFTHNHFVSTADNKNVLACGFWDNSFRAFSTDSGNLTFSSYITVLQFVYPYAVLCPASRSIDANRIRTRGPRDVHLSFGVQRESGLLPGDRLERSHADALAVERSSAGHRERHVGAASSATRLCLHGGHRSSDGHGGGEGEPDWRDDGDSGAGDNQRHKHAHRTARHPLRTPAADHYRHSLCRTRFACIQICCLFQIKECMYNIQ